MATHPVPHTRQADPPPAVDGPWRDPALSPEERVADLAARMTLEEKAAQLYGIWVGADAEGDGVAPHQNDMVDPVDFEEITTRGLGQLTRPFGTAPVDPGVGAVSLATAQARICEAGRFGIPALAHEECLAGFTAWGATAYPVPLAWGAAWDPELVAEMAHRIGSDMRSVGVHQGLAPVLDVVRDLRWGRVEETIGEDPYLVATIGTAYVRGLESSGIVATLKHFAGYSASAGARNLSPVRAGAREMADVILPPFEMAIREGGARSVMHSYAEIDGLPVAADPALLTGLLRDTWGFSGTVVADYFGVGFLETLHKVAAGRGDAARLALTAGVDVELPTVRSYGDALVAAVREGLVAEELVDRALHRVLLQKCELGLLDRDRPALPTVLDGVDPEQARGTVDLDPPRNRALARLLAERSCVLLANPRGALPLSGSGRIAVVGPRADDPLAMLGCYSFPSHVGVQHPEAPMGIEVPTVLEALREEFPDAGVDYAQGCEVDGTDATRIAEAAALAAGADVCVAVLGDRAGLFGRGTSGEGCDASDLALPGLQGDLLDALLATGTPVVLILLTGRTYALGGRGDRLAGCVQAFFPGEEGGPALAGVLSGRVNPSGRLPVGVPNDPGGQPWTYLQPPLGRSNGVSNLDPTPLYPFGHGLSYTSFVWEPGAEVPAELPTDGETDLEITVRNTGDRDGAEVVQLYVHDPVAQITRPEARLIGYARVPLAAGESRKVSFRFHPDLVSFTGTGGRRIVEPGDVELRFATSSDVADVKHTVRLRLTGAERTVDHRRRMVCATSVDALVAQN